MKGYAGKIALDRDSGEGTTQGIRNRRLKREEIGHENGCVQSYISQSLLRKDAEGLSQWQRHAEASS